MNTHRLIAYVDQDTHAKLKFKLRENRECFRSWLLDRISLYVGDGPSQSPAKSAISPPATPATQAAPKPFPPRPEHPHAPVQMPPRETKQTPRPHLRPIGSLGRSMAESPSAEPDYDARVFVPDGQ